MQKAFPKIILLLVSSSEEFSILLEKTVKIGAKVSELYGNMAYFRKDILELLEEQKIKGYIPV